MEAHKYSTNVEEMIQDIDLENKSRWFAYVEAPQQNKLYVSWDKNLDPGAYKLYMVVKDQSNNLITTPSIIVNIE